MGNTCKPMAVSFQCMTKSTTIKIKRYTYPLPLISILYRRVKSTNQTPTPIQMVTTHNLYDFSPSVPIPAHLKLELLCAFSTDNL